MTAPGAESGTAAAAMPASLVLAGAGKMGGAMLAGWLAAGLDPRRTTLIDPVPTREIVDLCAARGLDLNPLDPAPGAVLVLAIKPQGLAVAAAGLDRLIGRDTLLVSILAGKTVADLRGRLPRARALVRAMPNLPASIGRGATGAYASPEVSAGQRGAAEALLTANGTVAWLADEAQIDAVTAVSGWPTSSSSPRPWPRPASPPGSIRTWRAASPGPPWRAPARSSTPARPKPQSCAAT